MAWLYLGCNMSGKMDDKIKAEVEIYNSLNAENGILELRLGKINQEMFKIIGKLVILNDLNKKKEDKDD